MQSVLKKLSQNEKPANEKFAVFDLETDPFKRGRLQIHPFCSGLSDGKTSRVWWGKKCVPDMLAECRNLAKRGVKIIYAHNGGNFDFHFLLGCLPVSDCKFLCIGKRIVQLITPWGFEFRDSFAIIPKALAQYNKTKISYKKFESDIREKYKEEILAYLRDDLRDLHNMVSGFAKRFPLELTLSSATAKILKTEYDADIGRSDEAYDATYRPYYFAGRVQFWGLGKIPHKCATVDINSAFPWAMTLPHAHHFEFDIDTGNKAFFKKNFEQSFFTVECDSTGDLPLRKKDGGVDFPIGRFVFHVTGWELKAAMEVGTAKNVTVLIRHTPKETKDFKRFVLEFYGAKVAAKLRGDKEEEFFNKIVLNAAYGKTALNVKRYSEVAVTGIYDTPEGDPKLEPKQLKELGWKFNAKDELIDENGKPVTRRKLEKAKALAGWEVSWDDEDRGLTFHKRNAYRPGFDKFVNVATAASITGCVRALLIRSKAKCKNVVYCDTDSLTAEDVSNLPLSDTELGHWKLEMIYDPKTKCPLSPDGKEGFWIAGKKLYAGLGKLPGKEAKWKLASKGVKLTPEQIIKVALGGTKKHTSMAPVFSVFSKPSFVKRTIRRADKMGK